MRITTRSNLVLVVTAAISILSLACVGWFVVLNSFEEFERTHAFEAAQRAHRVLDEHEKQLYRAAVDYGGWIDAYQFALNPTPNWPVEQITDDVFNNLRTDLVAYYDASGKLLHRRLFDRTERSGEPAVEGRLQAVEGIDEVLVKDTALRARVSASKGVSGIVVHQGKLLIAAVSPVVQSLGQEPIVGYLVLSRLITPFELSEIGEAVAAKIDLSVAPAGSSCEGDGKCVEISTASGEIEGHSLIKGMKPDEWLVFSTSEPRKVYETGVQAFHTYLLAAMLVVLVMAMVKFVFLRRFLIAPLSDLTSRVASMGKERVLTPSRLTRRGDDEMGILEARLRVTLSELVEAERLAREEGQRADEHEKLARVGEFASGIVHEINNPAMVNRESARQLLTLVKSAEGQGGISRTQLSQLVERIHDATERIVTTVSAIKVLNDRTAPDSMSLTSLPEIIGNLRSVYGEHPRGADVQWPGAVPDVSTLCIPMLLTRAVSNLVDNALDATETVEIPEVRVEILEIGGHIQVIVSDNGEGIPAHLRAEIMKPFVSNKRQGKGMGLGLSIVSKIAQVHGGTLKLDPASASTRFVLEWPLRASTDQTDASGLGDVFDAMGQDPSKGAVQQ
jgi:signal transduction histidine kinase/sensor domain CHASE-containing protein